MKYFILRYIFLKSIFFLVNAVIEKMDTFRETYYKEYNAELSTNKVDCYQTYEKKLIKRELDSNIKITSDSYNSGIFLDLTQTDVNFINCTLKPGVFETHNFQIIEKPSYYNFFSSPGNNNPVLKNYTFHGLCTVKYIIIANNNIKSIETNAFDCAHDVINLDLSFNQIEYIPVNTFENMTQLRTLNLSKNFIQKLMEDTFKGLNNLSYLYLEENNLQKLEAESFTHLEKLNYLNLNDNTKVILHDHTFVHLKNLEYLELAGCNLTSTKHLNATSLRKLKGINLSNNRIQTVVGTDLAYIKDLHYLYFFSNNISILTNNSFFYHSELVLLGLGKNKLSRIESYYFKHLIKLIHLDLSENVIEIIERNSFDGMRSLQKITLRKNRINILFGFHLFQYNTFLTMVNASENAVSYINFTELQQSNIEELNLTNNEVKHLTLPKILKNITIHLEHNKLRYIYINPQESIKRRSSEKLKLHVSGNQIHCDCNNYELYKLLNDKNNSQIEILDEMLCHYPESQRGKKLKSLNANNFSCISCPERCTCEYDVQDDAYMQMDCSNKNFEYFPIVDHNSTIKLNIIHNNIDSLMNLSEMCWKNLVILHAENNRITSEEIFVPEGLKFLGLKSNKMATLPRTIQKHVQNTEDFKITLSNNSWPCDCSAVEFKLFLINNQAKVLDVNDIRCVYSNKSVSNHILIMMYDEKLCPTSQFIYGYFIAVFLLLLTLTIVFYCKYKLVVLSFIYTHCNCFYLLFCCSQPNDEETKEFDCFLSYSSKDTEVALSILQELESKPPYYKFCIHERNWVAGNYITKNIDLSVQNSRKTLIILTNDFVKSSWFYLEFQAAYCQTLRDKRDRLLIVLKGELPDKNQLDKNLQKFLSWKSSLQWDDPWLWEKLRYSLRRENPLGRNLIVRYISSRRDDTDRAALNVE